MNILTEASANTKSNVLKSIQISIVRVTVRTRGFVQRYFGFFVKMVHHVSGNLVNSFIPQTNKKIYQLTSKNSIKSLLFQAGTAENVSLS